MRGEVSAWPTQSCAVSLQFTVGRIFILSCARIAVDPAVLVMYIGIYELTPTLSIAITMENGQLMGRATHQQKFRMFPESQSKFFLKVVDAQLEFFRDANGQISHLVLHQDNHDTRGERKQ